MDRSSDNPRDLSNGQPNVHSTGTSTDRVEPRTTRGQIPTTELLFRQLEEEIRDISPLSAGLDQSNLQGRLTVSRLEDLERNTIPVFMSNNGASSPVVTDSTRPPRADLGILVPNFVEGNPPVLYALSVSVGPAAPRTGSSTSSGDVPFGLPNTESRQPASSDTSSAPPRMPNIQRSLPVNAATSLSSVTGPRNASSTSQTTAAPSSSTPITAASPSPNTTTSPSPNAPASPPTPNPPTESSARPSASSTSQHVHSHPSPFHDLYSQFEQQAARELDGIQLNGLGDLPTSVLNLLIGVMQEAKNTALDRLAPVQNFSGNDEFDCCICLDDIKRGEAVRKLPCCHTIHKECIDTWFKTSSRCPMCRTDYIEAGIKN